MEMRKKVNRGYRIFNIVASVIIGLFTLVCLIPFLLLLIGGVYLVIRKVITPTIPVAYIATVAVLTFLFPMGNDNVTWMAYQLLRPSDQSGYIVAFRREACPSGSVTVKLMGLDPSRNYRITNKDNGESIVKSGAELASGFDLRSDQPRSSLLLKYQAE